MAKAPTAREVARAETLDRIKTQALEQLATGGASELSLRGIARELDIVSSGIYRYYASRDELVTALIIDAYDDLAELLEEAGSGRRGVRRRWLDIAHALRGWALEEPHRFVLIYGSPIPGYVQPDETIEPAARVVRAFGLPVAEADAEPEVPKFSGALRKQIDDTLAGVELDTTPAVMYAVTSAFSRVIGMLTLELNGHFVGGFDPADDFYDAVVKDEADLLGL